MPLYGYDMGAFSPYQMSGGKDPYSLDQYGLPQYLHQELARNLGYSGDFGAGGHNAWLGADPTRQSAWDRAITEYKDQDAATNFGQLDWLMGEAQPGISRWQNQAINQYLGYSGGYGAGENNAWLQADPTRQQRYQDITGAFGALGKSPVVSGIGSLMGAFGQQQPMYPGMGQQNMLQQMGGPVPGNTTNNYYQSGPVDYGFGSMGAFGGGYGGYGGGYAPDLGYGGYGQYGSSPSAGAFTFADGGEVGYAQGGAIDALDPETRAMLIRTAKALGVSPEALLAEMTTAQQQRRNTPESPDAAAPGAILPQAPPPAFGASMPPAEDMAGFGGSSSYPGMAAPAGAPARRPMARPRPPQQQMLPSGTMPAPQGFGDDPALAQAPMGAFSGIDADRERSMMAPGPEQQGGMSTLEKLIRMLGLDKETGKPAVGAWQGEWQPQAQEFRRGGRVGMGAFA